MKVSPNLVFRKSSDRSGILFSLETGETFHLNPTAAFIWEQLEKGLDQTEIFEQLGEVTNPSPNAGSDLTSFIEELQKRGYLSE